MRCSRALAVALLPLAGCVVAPEQIGYGYPTPPVQAGAYAQEQEIYSGYNYNGGMPTIIVEGAAAPLMFYGGAWGYYDQRRQWRRAPEPVWRHLEQRHPSGAGMHRGHVELPRQPTGGHGYDRSPRRADWRGQQNAPRQDWRAPRASTAPHNTSRDRQDHSQSLDRYRQ